LLLGRLKPGNRCLATFLGQIKSANRRTGMFLGRIKPDNGNLAMFLGRMKPGNRIRPVRITPGAITQTKIHHCAFLRITLTKPTSKSSKFLEYLD